MANLLLNGRLFDIDLVVFDKDGTLIDFHHLWGQKAILWVEWLVERVKGDDSLREALYGTLGYDSKIGRTINDSPLAVASMPKLYTIAAAVLYQHGVNWHKAEDVVQESLLVTIDALPTHDLVKPVGDVAGVCRRLRESNVQIAIATSDNRLPTEATLPLLGITEEVSLLVCGDDDLPNKPAPDALWHIGSQLGVEPAKMMFVGDTISDMLTGTNAGVGCRVGILGGAGERAALEAQADVILASIDEIEVVSGAR
ncbi:MAG: HAD family hydrolase [Ardenticatenaceae bacterium]